jgi:hypothetical protein
MQRNSFEVNILDREDLWQEALRVYGLRIRKDRVKDPTSDKFPGGPKGGNGGMPAAA